jgi:hypothetical protein
MSLFPRLTKQLNDILNGDTARPSPMGKLAEFFRLGDRLDQLALLGSDERDPLMGDTPETVIGADLILVEDPLAVLPGLPGVPRNVGQVLRDYATGFGGTLPPPANVQGAVVVELDILGTRASRRLRQADIDADFAISSFIGPAALQELGATINNPTFTAAYSPAAALAGLTLVEVVDDQGGSVVDVTSIPTGFNYPGVYAPTVPDTAVTWSLQATELGVANAQVVATWVNQVYHGPSPAGAHDDAFILALASSQLNKTRALTYTDTAGASDFLYHALPSRLGVPTFIIGGFESIYTLVANGVMVTNGSGFTEAYDLWRSTNPGLGSTTVEVS